jgi:hypothetical protein
MVSVLASVVADVGSISSRVKPKSIKLVFTRNIIVCVWLLIKRQINNVHIMARTFNKLYFDEMMMMMMMMMMVALY